MLLDGVTCPPVMAFPNFDKPFVLHTDASHEGPGAVLYQGQDGKIKSSGLCVKDFNSRRKKKTTTSGKLEFLVLKKAATEKFIYNMPPRLMFIQTIIA